MKFELTNEQYETVRAWHDTHDAETGHFSEPNGPIGGTLRYELTPTSIGTAVAVKCSICGAELDITDYDSW